jgi:hypothetical protein
MTRQETVMLDMYLGTEPQTCDSTGHAIAQLFEALRYKSEVRGFDSPMVS